ncbi:MAG TPA: NADH-quinone oxidoreductase subunit NuoF [Thermodesulfovibrionales bacterium]|nr:NADH-quinone oxidoreductase subunit NuoF [Thermodesulfovibrionales bacterium]
METPLTRNIKKDRKPLNLGEYERAGGYQAAHKALKTMTPEEVIRGVKDSRLRGRGGAGFPTGMKWDLMPKDAPHPRYLVANADEMEPGTFKDRILLEGDPHQFLEGVIISSYAIQADISYIFLRLEYSLAAERLERAIAEAYDNNYLGKNIFGSGHNLEVRLHTSAGRYMCGEETALLNSLEGRRLIPRAKPPYATTVGLWGKPTAVNNVETLCNVPHIILNGAAWFRGLSRSEDGGTKIFGVSGRVKNPGAWELPMGTTIREILEDHAGGMRDGFRLRGIIPGGASTDFLLEEHLDAKMDFDSLQKFGSRMGTGTMIILDDRTCPVGMVLNLERFFARESCGWCTPCREGLPWIVNMLEAIEDGRGLPEDIDVLQEQASLLGPGMTFCALAPGAMEPLQSALKHFRTDFDRHIIGQSCPWR